VVLAIVGGAVWGSASLAAQDSPTSRSPALRAPAQPPQVRRPQVQRPPPRTLTERIEVSGGVGWMGAVDLGQQDAALRANVASTAGERPFRVFASQTRLTGAAVADGRVGYRLTSQLTVEGRLAFGRPTLRTTVSGDIETSAATTVSDRVSHYSLDGGIRASIPWPRGGGGRAVRSVTPFVTAGVGVLRQMSGGRVLVETGSSYYVGGGIRQVWWTNPRGVLTSSGLRADVRWDVLTGHPVGDTSRVRPSVGASLFVAF
jgi:hypothetical protein